MQNADCHFLKYRTSKLNQRDHMKSRGQIVQHDLEQGMLLVLPSEISISRLYLCWHTIMDITFGLVGTIILLLILPIIAVLIYFDSPGPIFYSQERLGFRGKIFRIYKFRSMQTDAEQDGYPVWAADDDVRVTSIGRFMRALHLDELPQVLNILRGEMSLIGPRPEREEFTRELEQVVPSYRLRLAVKPGLTGWAQVNYHYTRTQEEAFVKLDYDLNYIKHRSFQLDLVIIFKTVVEVLSYHGT